MSNTQQLRRAAGLALASFGSAVTSLLAQAARELPAEVVAGRDAGLDLESLAATAGRLEVPWLVVLQVCVWAGGGAAGGFGRSAGEFAVGRPPWGAGRIVAVAVVGGVMGAVAGVALDAWTDFPGLVCWGGAVVVGMVGPELLEALVGVSLGIVRAVRAMDWPGILRALLTRRGNGGATP